MKWLNPELGAVRVSPAFALLPCQCEDGFTVWLRRVWHVEVRTLNQYGIRVWRELAVYSRRDSAGEAAALARWPGDHAYAKHHYRSISPLLPP